MMVNYHVQRPDIVSTPSTVGALLPTEISDRLMQVIEHCHEVDDDSKPSKTFCTSPCLLERSLITGVLF